MYLLQFKSVYALLTLVLFNISIRLQQLIMNKEDKKIIVVTGGNSGVGFAACQYFYNQGHTVIFGSRTQQRNKAAVSAIQKQYQGSSNPSITAYQLDLCERKSIQQFVNKVREGLQNKKINYIDVLVNNAALFGDDTNLVCRHGIEETLLANHFGHFYLTYLLFPLVRNSKQGRIVNVSSDMHYKMNDSQQRANGQYDASKMWDFVCQSKKYNNLQQYAISKLFNVLFTVGLQNYLKQINALHVKTVTLHPGFVDTNFGSQSEFVQNIKKQYAAHMITKQMGCKGIIALCEREFKDLSEGKYHDEKGNLKQMNKLGCSQPLVQKLWKISQSMYQINYRNN